MEIVIFIFFLSFFSLFINLLLADNVFLEFAFSKESWWNSYDLFILFSLPLESLWGGKLLINIGGTVEEFIDSLRTTVDNIVKFVNELLGNESFLVILKHFKHHIEASRWLLINSNMESGGELVTLLVYAHCSVQNSKRKHISTLIRWSLLSQHFEVISNHLKDL